MSRGAASPSQDRPGFARLLALCVTNAQSSQYLPGALSLSLSPLTCGRSRRHGRRRLPVGCVHLVAVPKNVSGLHPPCACPRGPSAPRVRTLCLSCGASTSSKDRPDSTPLLALRVPALILAWRSLFARPPSSPGRLRPPRRHPAEREWPTPIPARALAPSAPRVRTPCMSRGAATHSQHRPDRAVFVSLHRCPVIVISAWRGLFVSLADPLTHPPTFSRAPPGRARLFNMAAKKQVAGCGAGPERT